MGCLLTLLFFIVAPFLYMWFQTQRMMSRFNDRFNNPDNTYANNSGSTNGNMRNKDTTNADSQRKDGKKPHVFKPGEGEYVDFSETKD